VENALSHHPRPTEQNHLHAMRSIGSTFSGIIAPWSGAETMVCPLPICSLGSRTYLFV